MAGIGNVQLGVRLTQDDVHNQRISNTATGMGSATGGFIWNPTTRSILKREETDKQNDDNLTFLFEYRALLNSRVQTLITQLSNALASDLDIAINASNPRWEAPVQAGEGGRPAMNGLSSNTIQDAGAGRSAYNFLMGWFENSSIQTAGSVNAIDNYSVGADGIKRIGPAESFAADFTTADLNAPAPGTPRPGTDNAPAGTLRINGGTSTIVSAPVSLADVLDITNLRTGNPSYLYANRSSDVVAGGGTTNYNVLDDSFDGPLGAAARNAQAKNLFEKILFDAVSSVEYRPVLSSGLFKNLVVAASSSLPTGSQMQASFNLTYQGTQEGGNLFIGLDKMTCFYHS